MVKVAQCWDDGTANDRKLTDILRRYGAKATFNLNPGFIPERTVSTWWAMGRISGTGFRSGRIGKRDLLEVYGDFKVASHCMNHENAGKVPLQQFVTAAVDARKYLEDIFQRECPGFAWPYGTTTPDSVKALADAGFSYGRTTQTLESILTWDKPLELASNCHFLSSEFWTRFDIAKKENGIFYFWGHSYEMMDCSGLWTQYENKIALLSQDPEVEWIDVCDIPALLQNKKTGKK